MTLPFKKPGVPFPVIALLFVCLVAVMPGCATKALTDARAYFYQGNMENALKALEDPGPIPKRNKLLYYMEKGAILHDAGLYQDSIETFLKASALMEEQDVIRLANQSASLISSERITEYKGEYSERLWVHTYLMMNFLLTNQFEGALVEAKQALQLLDDFPDALQEDYFTRALIGFCFENLREWNGAYVEYKKLAKVMPNSADIAPILYRLALRLGFADDAEAYKKTMAGNGSIDTLGPRPAELVVFVGTGRIPAKITGDIVVPPAYRFSFPRYGDVKSELAEIRSLDKTKKSMDGIAVITHAGEVAQSSLEKRRVAVIAKETARVAAKEVIAQQVDDDAGAAVGAILRIVFFALEEADTRCWQTFPRSLTLMRIPLSAGPHQIRMEVRGRSGAYQTIVLPDFSVGQGEKKFFSFRLDENFTRLSPDNSTSDPVLKISDPP